MSRNKYPEQTIEKILTTSMKLFVKKGYDNTTIQDIINDLGMSKGAIYHHFKSKEEIIVAALEVTGEALFAEINTIIKNESGTALEKMRKVMLFAMKSSHQMDVAEAMPTAWENPKFLAMQIRSDYTETAPRIFEPLIRMGIEDGSIKTEFPRELAQVLLLVLNVWVNPFVFSVSHEELCQKCKFFQHMTQSLGVSLLDEEMIEIMCGIQTAIQKVELQKK